ncbi:E3 ubiquitin-protein ligase MBR2-like [Aristolochia californica]|uniref:E3 ubiquitin-protein ligase MBR2-like n=1 Tax=Aristolochia californica TaxID=171875 RepID=UPI0035E17DCD
MDDYGGKRGCEGLGLAGNRTALALRDSHNVSRNTQYCNRQGCSSRITPTKDIKISNSERGKSLKPSFHSSSSKSIPGSSSKSSPGVNGIKKFQQTHRKELVLGRSTRAHAETEIDASGSTLNPVDFQTGQPNANGVESSELSGLVVDTTTQEVGSSVTTSNVRSRKQTQESSGSNQDIGVAPMLRRNLSSKSTSQAASSSSQGLAVGPQRYGLRNFSCSSISDLLPSGCSSSDSNRNRRIDLTKKRRSPDAGTSSTRAGSTSRPSFRGGSILHRPSVPGSSQTYPERSLAQQAIERARNRPSGGNSTLASVRTRRIIGGTTRVQSSEHMAHGNSSLPESALISHSSETENIINESTASSSTGSFTSELPSNNQSLRFQQLGLSNASRTRPVVHPEDNSSWTLRGLSIDRDSFRRFNMDGIAEVLLALERIEQDEELRHEQLLVLETNLLLGGLDFHDQHREMRLDIDNMSYEELLALEEQMGTVSTALSGEELSNSLKRCFYQAIALDGGILSNVDDDIKCSICQEEYEEGDEIGKLRCEHGYHVNCIHQWLRLKNWCPICKASASSSS